MGGATTRKMSAQIINHETHIEIIIKYSEGNREIVREGNTNSL